MEKWLPVVGFEGLYEISDEARVRSLHPHNKGLLMSVYNRSGYASVILSKNGHATQHHLHRLMAMAFHPNPENKRFAIFLDGNRKNLSLENLKWANYQELSLYSRSAKHWGDLIIKIRKDYTPDLVRELTESYHLRPAYA